MMCTQWSTQVRTGIPKHPLHINLKIMLSENTMKWINQQFPSEPIFFLPNTADRQKHYTMIFSAGQIWEWYFIHHLNSLTDW